MRTFSLLLLSFCFYFVGEPKGLAQAPAGGASRLGGGAAPAEQTEGAKTEYDAGAIPKAVGLEFARFRWWAPEGVKVRGVIVVLPGRGGDARGAVTQAQWQKLAEEIQFGVMGCQLKNPADEPYTYQGDPNGAVSDLINKAVTALLAQNGQTLKNPPLCLWGHSAGGNVSQCYASRHPERVVGAILVRATGGPGSLAPGKESVPMLVLIGQKDKPDWVAASTEAYTRGNAANAVWTLALHPNEGHGVGNTEELYLTFLSSVVKLRLPAPTPFPSASSSRPKKLARQQSWLGSTVDYEVAAYSAFKGKKNTATWLPDEATAKAWQTYMQK